MEYLEKRDSELHKSLIERATKINEDFIWDDAKIKRILQIGKWANDVLMKAHNEAVETADLLEQRISNNDSFLEDYEIVAQVDCFCSDFEVNEFDEDDIESIAKCQISEPDRFLKPIRFDLSHDHYEIWRNDEEWQRRLACCRCSRNKLPAELFNYEDVDLTIYALLNSGFWSYQDIIDITNISADVEVIHQYRGQSNAYKTSLQGLDV